MLVRAPAIAVDDTDVDGLSDRSWLEVDLNDADPAVRTRAARALRATPSGIPALCRRLEIEPVPSVRAAVLTALIRLKSADVVERLTVFLRNEDVALRGAVIEALQAMPDVALPALERLLGDVDVDVRIFAVNVLNDLRHPDVPAVLMRVLADDASVNVGLVALDGLAELHDDGLVPALTTFIARFPEVPNVQFVARSLIDRIRGTA